MLCESSDRLHTIDWDKEAPVIYHSAFDHRGFSKAFRDKYKALSGDPQPPEAWPHEHIRVDNRISMNVIQEIGVENCGKGLTVAVVPRKAIGALRIMDMEGVEYPELDPDRYIVFHLQELYKSGKETVTHSEFSNIVMESKALRLRIISRAHLSPGASTSNRYSCLTTLSV